MEKPTIFFSHSSADKNYINHLKNIVLKRTSKTVEVFQSSDGESIPFGNNWIHKIEENLKKSKIMLVFVSPKSIQSGWIYFEAGYAYSKDIKVIPVGIEGIDIGLLKPPLNLLQGFNISNTEGLNNIIAILNREFNTEFDYNFQADDYESLPSADSTEAAEIKTLEIIDKVIIEFPPRIADKNGESSTISEHPAILIKETLGSLSFKYSTAPGKDYEVHSHGLSSKSLGEHNALGLRLEIDPYCLEHYKDIFNISRNRIYSRTDLGRGWCRVTLNENSRIITDKTRLSSLLFNAGLEKLDNTDMYEFDGWGITTDLKPKDSYSSIIKKDTIRLTFPIGEFSSKKLISIIQLLLSAKAITQVE